MITTCIFDAYGTLFDVKSAARAVADEKNHITFAKHWVKVANTWRSKQLQYTWLRTIMNQYSDFWQVTKDGLDFALEESGIQSSELRERLLALYWKLSAYPEVLGLLSNLKSNGYNTGILSNGSPEMLNSAVNSAGLNDFLDAVLSVDKIGIYKPSRHVYQMVLDNFKCTAEKILFVSSNSWDVAGSTKFGFQTLWVNRDNEPPDRLDTNPPWTAKSLVGIPTLLKDLA